MWQLPLYYINAKCVNNANVSSEVISSTPIKVVPEDAAGKKVFNVVYVAVYFTDRCVF